MPSGGSNPEVGYLTAQPLVENWQPKPIDRRRKDISNWDVNILDQMSNSLWNIVSNIDLRLSERNEIQIPKTGKCSGNVDRRRAGAQPNRDT